MTNTEHSSKQYDADLESIRSRVLQMGGLVESQILAAARGLARGDFDSTDQVVKTGERVNGYEVSIDQDCAHIIARRQPAAGDLRMIMGISKIVTDLERIGDEAEKIARMSRQIHERGKQHTPRITDIRYVADQAIEMLRHSLDAFARLDAAQAAEIIREDVSLDHKFRAILRQLITYMMEDPRTISTSLDIVWIAKAIERIGDHSKNVAEQVIYIVKGTDVRHTSFEEVEKEVKSN